jgi:general stress protein 26
MADNEPVVELDPRFSSEGATPRPWSEVVDALARSEIFWLSTVRKDGRPHVTPLPAMWLDDALHFCTGAEEQKARNLEGNPHCVLTTGSSAFRSGLDIVAEGDAKRVTDETRLRSLAELWASKLDWHFDVVDGAFRERGSEVAGEEFNETGAAIVFAVAPTKVLAFGKGEPFSQTRYRFHLQ